MRTKSASGIKSTFFPRTKPFRQRPHDIANQRFNPTSDDEKDIVLTFAKWAQTNDSVHTVPEGASFSDIQVLFDAKAEKKSAGAFRTVAVPMTRGVVVPLPRKRKRGDTLTPSHILKVNPAKRSRRLLQDQWRVDPLILTYLTNALKGKRSPSISLKTSTKRSIDAMVQIAQSLPSSLKDSLTQENLYMALDHLLNEKPSTCTKHRPTFEANAPYLFTRAVPKATIRDGFVSTSLLHHRLLEQLQSMLQDFKPEKFNMAQSIHCTAASKMRYTNEAQFLPATG